jgi:hypothetical protein
VSEAAEILWWLGDGGAALRRRIRILMLLDAADYAVISPLSIPRFHAFAFLADVLSPIYNFVPLAGRIMKRRAGPYFPELQWEADRLIGLGLVNVENLKAHVESATASVTADVGLDRERAQPILDVALREAGLADLQDFLRELAGALGAIPDSELDDTTRTDVTWMQGHQGAVIDYAEWRAKNYSEGGISRIEAAAASAWGSAAGELSSGAKINLYVHYLRRAAHG